MANEKKSINGPSSSHDVRGCGHSDPYVRLLSGVFLRSRFIGRWCLVAIGVANAFPTTTFAAAGESLTIDGSVTNNGCPDGGIIRDGGRACEYGGTKTFDSITLINGAVLYVTAFDNNQANKPTMGNLVLRSLGNISIDRTSRITAKGMGWQPAICNNGAGPSAFAGGRGGCAVRDSGGGGAHFGRGGTGTKDCFAVSPADSCQFPEEWEEACVDPITGVCLSGTTSCWNYDELVTTSGQPFYHHILEVEFGASGGDKGCRDGDGAGVTQAGGGGGRIALVASQGTIDIQGRVIADGQRGCALGNDSAGGGAGGTILVIGDTVRVGQYARVSVKGGRGGDSQPKALTCSVTADCYTTAGTANSQTCRTFTEPRSGNSYMRCDPSNCRPCGPPSNSSCPTGYTCRNFAGDFDGADGTQRVCVPNSFDPALLTSCASTPCGAGFDCMVLGPTGTLCVPQNTPVCDPIDFGDNESECATDQRTGTCDDCAGGGGGGIINIQSNVSDFDSRALFDVTPGRGGICPICEGQAGGGMGELLLDGAYPGEICDAFDDDFDGSTDETLGTFQCGLGSCAQTLQNCTSGAPTTCTPTAGASDCLAPPDDGRPRMVVVLDTSASMLLDLAGLPTFGDGSVEQPGRAGAADSRLKLAREALAQVATAYPEIDFTLARYHQDHDDGVQRRDSFCQTAAWYECQSLVASYDDPANNTGDVACSNLAVSGGTLAQVLIDPAGDHCINYAGTCGAPRRGADILSGFGTPTGDMVRWLDGRETNTTYISDITPGDICGHRRYDGDCEVRASGPTPLAGSLQAVSDYIIPIRTTDSVRDCRDYSVILFTDGAESCNGNPATEAGALYAAGIPVYVIAVAASSEMTGLNQIANQGSGGVRNATEVNSPDEFVPALTEIVGQSLRTEKCNSIDDDCDGLTDEGFNVGAPCSAGVGACYDDGNYYCLSDYQTACDAAAGAPGSESSPETNCRDGIDNDCNGQTDCADTICRDRDICKTCVVEPEICDNQDNDCDGDIDEELTRQCGTDVGECGFGDQTCTAGVWSACDALGASQELCDNLDNDCDGVTDGFTRVCPTGVGVGECQPGWQTCSGGNWPASDSDCTGVVGPSTEICDNKDNDCDSQTDENAQGNPLERTCGLNLGICSSGSEECISGAWINCDATLGGAELCDALDNDCDGQTDEGNPGGGAPCGTVPLCGGQPCGECRYGTEVCVNGDYECRNALGPTVELCDGKDNDCDGLTDEDESGNPLTRPCSTACGLGTQTCSLAAWGACSAQPTVEICNGVDDDCDGAIDEGDLGGSASCNDGSLDDALDTCDVGGVPCGQCQLGSVVCVESELRCVGIIGPTAELCDAVDNDCDGETDESAAGTGAPCNGPDSDFCNNGSIACIGGHLVCFGYTDNAESCNGADDDCDGETDEGNPGGGASCDEVCNPDNPGDCQHVLETPLAVCSREVNGQVLPCGECRWGAISCIDGALTCRSMVGPGQEICDGLDNDCDGHTDENESMDGNGNNITVNDAERLGETCGNDQGECKIGISECRDGGIVCQGSIDPTEERCDGLDNDCDGSTDEDIPVGAPCGSSVGECELGKYICDMTTGTLVCDGGRGPAAETCDGRDNNCNGVVDEGLQLGESCGSDEGECKSGRYQCVNGGVNCVGAIGPTKEQCDCLDNNCDGQTDEATEGALCPGGSMCIDCQCALSCTQSAEFRDICPTGKSAYKTSDNQCYCVGERCQAAKCAKQTVERSGDTLCEPHGEKVGPCVCKNNRCTFPCDSVVCTGGLICDPNDGVCKVSSCTVFGCDEGKRCAAVAGVCEPDPCATAACSAVQACRDGVCIKSCALVTCENGQRCVDGVCETDKCAGASCESGQSCNPQTGLCETNRCLGIDCAQGFVCETVSGECTPDPCLNLRCPSTQSCQDGTCIVRCPSGGIDCAGSCVDPLSDRDFCGAAGACVGDSAGVSCTQDQVCANGVCANECPGGQVKCDNSCVDPKGSMQYCGASDDCLGDKAGKQCAYEQVCVNGICASECPSGKIKCAATCIEPASDKAYCGASGDCQGDSAGRVCKSSERCQNGGCVAIVVADAGTQDGAVAKNSSVIAAGGGGCACTVPSSGKSRASERGLWIFGLALLTLFLYRQRRRGRKARVSHRPARGQAKRLLRQRTSTANIIAISTVFLFVAFAVSGCSVNPFCLDCKDSGAGSSVHDGGKGQAGNDAQFGQADGSSDANGATSEGGIEDGEVIDDGGTDACVNADLEIDPENCGQCGRVCQFAHAFAKCVVGQCEMNGCDVAYQDLDQDQNNGCEYYCLPTALDDTSCDLSDNDCDGEVDEEVDFMNDSKNCGQCSRECHLPNALKASICKRGECALDNSQCDQGYHDIDGEDSNGCEYECTLANPLLEVCNLKDDDCDGATDEEQGADPNGNNITVNQSDSLNQPCGKDTGECEFGNYRCVSGDVKCQGGVDPTTEVCDGKDNNCDGQTDESDARIGKACTEYAGGAYQPVGICKAGLWQCNAGQLQCVGGQAPVPEICDGLDNNCDFQIDENGPGDGQSCGTLPANDLDSNGNPRGECRLGAYRCVGGQRLCEHIVGAVIEVCDNKDNDCDGETDTGDDGNPLLQACGSNRGACKAGTEQCISGEWKYCSATQGSAEECNGLDDDCDGEVDEASAGVPLTQSCATACGVGEETCSWGNWQGCSARTPTAEICNNIDDDCDGTTDETLEGPPLTQSCISACGTGIETCSAGAWLGCTAPQAEIETCNAIDDDCDGFIDEKSDGTPLTQGCTNNCGSGNESCFLGAWQGCDAPRPTVEVCDGTDNDCDGQTDEEFNLQTDLHNCGSCGHTCSFLHTNAKCELGLCVTVSCESGYWNDPNQSANETGQNCLYACDYEGQEVCNGQDDNCNGVIQADEDALDPPPSFCYTYGVCGSGGVSSIEPTCSGAAGWVCNYSSLTNYQTDESYCDGLDNDCDGATDELYGQLRQSCTSPTGVGSCITRGTWQCDPSDRTNEPICADTNQIAVMEGLPTAEVCNHQDDDCDGLTDEPCGDPTTGNDSSCVRESWVQMPGSPTTYIYAYEASRPDATDNNGGSSNARACSNPDVLPWTNVTHTQAEAACEAAGARLCTEAEWETACMNMVPTDCSWSYAEEEGIDCHAYGDGLTCNAADYDTDSLSAGNQDEVLPTGSMPSCYREYNSAQVYDLSGNVKEWAWAREPGVNPLRGGASNNNADGTRCDFDFTVANDQFFFSNVGFRCCSGECVTYNCSAIRTTEYYIESGRFTGTTFSLTLDQPLTANYFVIIQGSDGTTNLDEGPDANYVRLTDDPSGTGDLDSSGATNRIRFTRGGAGINSWVGVITVVESLADHDTAGFRLLDVQALDHPLTTNTPVQTGADTSAVAWSNINQVALMGGFNGAGCSTGATATSDSNSCFANIYPAGTNTINWERDDNNDNGNLKPATSSVMVIQWGSEWTVQRATVNGNNGGSGNDAVDEYSTADINSVPRARTWVWGTGYGYFHQPIRVTEYYIADNTFTGTDYDLTLSNPLASDYFVIVQGSDGAANAAEGPDADYVRLTRDPNGTGDLDASGATNRIRLTRGGTGVDSWLGVVTVVESIDDNNGAGFRLLDVQAVVHPATTDTAVQTGSDTSAVQWSNINQVMLMGGFNGAGCATAATATSDHQSCFVNVYPDGNDAIVWQRDDDNAPSALKDATSTVMVIQWGSEWTVQRRLVDGTNGGSGNDDATEYSTAAINSVARDHTWVWGTGYSSVTSADGAAEGTLITLGNGGAQNTDETSVAVGTHVGGSARAFTVYALTHRDILVDYRFKALGDGNASSVNVTVDSASTNPNRFALGYNSISGSNTNYPRAIFSTRYTSATNVRMERRRTGTDTWAAWVQAIQFNYGSAPGAGSSGEGTIVTLGDGVNQNENETKVAVGTNTNNSARAFTVYAFTHPDIQVDYRFKTLGNRDAATYDVTVNDASTCSDRVALGYNSIGGGNSNYPKPNFSARYNNATTVRMERLRTRDDDFAAWVQAIQMCQRCTYCD